jgi:hypothetical protein
LIKKLEIHKAKDGVTVEALTEVLKSGQDLIGKDYLKRMRESKLIGDTSFVAKLNGQVYLISFYLLSDEYERPSQPLESLPSLKNYLEKIKPLFEDSQSLQLDTANSFWTDAHILEELG